MTVFDFSHFPHESELFRDIDYAFRIQCDNGAVDTIRTGILNARRTDPDYDQADWEIDSEGVDLLSAIESGARTVSDLDEEEREILAVLWVNYMCDKPRRNIVQNVGSLINKGVDIEKHSMEMIRQQLMEDMHEESSKLGAIMYLWTLVCVKRAIVNSINLGLPESTMTAPPMFGNVSLN